MLVLLTHFSIHPSSFLVDVEELHQWHVAKCTAHPSFERLPDEEVLRGQSAVQLPPVTLSPLSPSHTLIRIFSCTLIALSRNPSLGTYMYLMLVPPICFYHHVNLIRTYLILNHQTIP